MACEQDYKCIFLSEGGVDKGSFDGFTLLHPRQLHGHGSCFLPLRELTKSTLFPLYPLICLCDLTDVARDRMWLL